MIFDQTFLYSGHERLSLAWSNPNETGAFLAAVAGITYVSMDQSRWEQNGSRRPFIAFAGLGLRVALWWLMARTYSRGAVVSSVVGIGVMSGALCGWKRKIRFCAVEIACLAALIILVAEWHRLAFGFVAGDNSVRNRVTVWLGCLKLLGLHPLRGMGSTRTGSLLAEWFVSPRLAYVYDHNNNSYLDAAVHFGIPMLAVLMTACLLPLALLREWIVRGTPSAESSLPRQFIVPCGAIWATWMVGNAFSSLWIAPTLWVIPIVAGAAMVYALWRLVRTVWRFLCLSTLAIGVGFVGAIEGIRYAGGTIVSDLGSETIQLSRRARRNAVSGAWQMWPDPTVLGWLPGRRIRLWWSSCPAWHDDLLVHRYWSGKEAIGKFDDLVLFGRQAEHLMDVAAKTSSSNRIWLVNPCVSDCRTVAGQVGSNVHLVLSNVPERPFWLEWARLHGADTRLLGWGGENVGCVLSAILSPRANARPDWIDPVQMLPSARDRLTTGSEQMRLNSIVRDTLRGVTIDGDLDLAYTLGANSVTDQMGLKMLLTYQTEIGLDGRAVASWYVPGLQPAFQPSGDGILAFSDGTGRVFTHELLARPEDWSKSDWLGFRCVVEQRSADVLRPDEVWHFQDGGLERVEDQRYGRIRVNSDRSQISSIYVRSFDSDLRVLSAEYNAEGHLATITVYPYSPNQLRWNGAFLEEWDMPGQEGHLTFHYKKGLLTEIYRDGRLIHRIAWSTIPEKINKAFVHPLPVYVSQLDGYRFDMSVSSAGIVIKRSDFDGKSTSVVTFNPVTGAVEANNAKQS